MPVNGVMHRVAHRGEAMENRWCCIVYITQSSTWAQSETIMTHIRLDQASFIVPQGHINLVAVTKY